MPIVKGLCNSYKEEILRGVHSEVATYKIALYTSIADLNDETTAYTMLGEVSNGVGYKPGGRVLTGLNVQLERGTAYLDFDDPAWGPGATIKASGALIYNDSMLKKAVAVLSFGSSHSCVNGKFVVELPEPTRLTALIRVV